MKTIECVAKEFSEKSVWACPISFKAGVEFAQRWISVEDELPNAEGEANRLSKVVMAKCEDLADEVSAYYDTITKDWRIYPSGQIIKATHWRPIELK